jgi:hypothetical protein
VRSVPTRHSLRIAMAGLLFVIVTWAWFAVQRSGDQASVGSVIRMGVAAVGADSEVVLERLSEIRLPINASRIDLLKSSCGCLDAEVVRQARTKGDVAALRLRMRISAVGTRRVQLGMLLDDGTAHSLVVVGEGVGQPGVVRLFAAPLSGAEPPESVRFVATITGVAAKAPDVYWRPPAGSEVESQSVKFLPAIGTAESGNWLVELRLAGTERGDWVHLDVAGVAIASASVPQ